MENLLRTVYHQVADADLDVAMPTDFELSVDVVGEKELLEALGTVEKGMLDLNQLGVWKWVQSRFYEIEKQLFGSEGATGQHGKWQELSSPYKEVKSAEFGDLPILQRDGNLMKSMTSEGADGAVVERTPQTLTLGSSLPTAAFHSSDEPRTKIPLRRIVDFTNKQKEYIAEPIKTKLKQLVANAKLKDSRRF